MYSFLTYNSYSYLFLFLFALMCPQTESTPVTYHKVKTVHRQLLAPPPPPPPPQPFFHHASGESNVHVQGGVVNSALNVSLKNLHKKCVLIILFNLFLRFLLVFCGPCRSHFPDLISAKVSLTQIKNLIYYRI